MNASEKLDEIFKALAKAQGEIQNPSLDGENPFFKSKYATLSSVIESIKKVFSKNGLSFVQLPVCKENSAGCITVLSHESGQYIEEMLMLPCKKVDAHGVAAAITYARRLSLQSIAGVVGEQDDDGNAAVDKNEVYGNNIETKNTNTKNTSNDTQKGDHAKVIKILSIINDIFENNQPNEAPEIALNAYKNSNLNDTEKRVFMSKVPKDQKELMLKASEVKK